MTDQERSWPERLVIGKDRRFDTLSIWGQDETQVPATYEARTYIPADSLKPIIEQLRDRARTSAGQKLRAEQDYLDFDTAGFYDGKAQAFTEAADQLTSLCNRGATDAT